MSRTVLKSKKIQLSFNIVAGIIILITALTSFTTLVRFDAEVTSRKQADFMQKNTTNYYHHMLTFCYENNIHPCDETAIQSWNSSHPTDMFEILTPSDLRNESNKLSY